MKRIHSILVLVFLFFFHFVQSQSEWVLRKEKNGIFIYDLKTDTSRFNSIKVETEFAGSIDDLVAILMDVGSHYKWAYGTKSAMLLKRISDKEIIFYKEISSPGFVVSDRDLVIRLKVIPHPATKSIHVESMAIPDYIPSKKNMVRVLFSNETWKITPLTNQTIKISYFLQIDPGGELPPFLVNLFVTKGPYETFSNLKELMKNRSKN